MLGCSLWKYFILEESELETCEVWKDAIAFENYTLSGGLDTPVSNGSSTTTINLPNNGGAQE